MEVSVRGIQRKNFPPMCRLSTDQITSCPGITAQSSYIVRCTSQSIAEAQNKNQHRNIDCRRAVLCLVPQFVDVTALELRARCDRSATADMHRHHAVLINRLLTYRLTNVERLYSIIPVYRLVRDYISR